MKRRVVTIAGVVTLGLLVAVSIIAVASREDDDGDEDKASLSMPDDSAIALERGIAASAREGTPISAKYEVEDGKLQLSVYTMKANTFSEVIVDHTSGKIGKVTPITEGEDLVAATSQKDAMTRARRPLAEATTQVVRAHRGQRAISATPRIKDGHPVAEIILASRNGQTTVYEKLD
jgi:hypothetical protein